MAPIKDAGTPRVFLARHGETEWTKTGRHTGLTELELTTDGVNQVLGSGKRLVGPGKLVDPSKIARVFVSPRKRAQKTLELLFNSEKEVDDTKVTVTEEIAEWNYGEYEGLLTGEIKEKRKGKGLDVERPWDIWRDGCEGGESPEQVAARLDSLIKKIHEIQGPNMHGESPADVVLVAHGHILRAFTKRFLNYPLEFPLSIMMHPGAIGVLSYQHNRIEEPALCVGMALPLE